ncbi:LPXTG cell wall anchor domain-containing protein [Staphylococcus muscae]|uniref:Gram-positive cocci surface proteins LPxTG domain-containing protein n=1 Tax=Staphylococcus muscae TaxID=1294 RepID=A0ABQ1HMJ1_9STAP|nr:LPXTG cell wall anchor domain-containing protein [Staphylococcus muscae]GGA82140.1 hypothetical protein GCM10007183_02890 [Staphylococcus muscae]
MSKSVHTSESLLHVPPTDSLVTKDVPKVEEPVKEPAKVPVKEQLPDTGQVASSNHISMMGAIAAMLGGLGFMKRSRKDEHQE